MSSLSQAAQNDIIGRMKLLYTLVDSDSDNATMELMISDDDGVTYRAATLDSVDEGTISGNKVSGVSSSPSGKPHWIMFKFIDGTDTINLNTALDEKSIVTNSRITITRNDNTQTIVMGGADPDYNLVQSYSINKSRQFGIAQLTMRIVNKDGNASPEKTTSALNLVSSIYEPLFYFANKIKVEEGITQSDGTILWFNRFIGYIAPSTPTEDRGMPDLEVIAYDVLRKVEKYMPDNLVYEATKTKVTTETLTTTDNITYTSAHSSWAEYPPPRIYVDGIEQSEDTYAIDYVNGKVVFRTPIEDDIKVASSNRRVFATPTRRTIAILNTHMPEMEIGVMTANGTLLEGERLTDSGNHLLFNSIRGNWLTSPVPVILREYELLSNRGLYEGEGELAGWWTRWVAIIPLSQYTINYVNGTVTLNTATRPFAYKEYNGVFLAQGFLYMIVDDASGFAIGDEIAIESLTQGVWENTNVYRGDYNYDFVTITDIIGNWLFFNTQTKYVHTDGDWIFMRKRNEYIRAIYYYTPDVTATYWYYTSGTNEVEDIIRDLCSKAGVLNSELIKVISTPETLYSSDNLNYFAKYDNWTGSDQIFLNGVRQTSGFTKTLRSGKITFTSALNDSDVVTATYDYYGLQATGITLDLVRFTLDSTNDGLDAITQLLENVAPNYIVEVDSNGIVIGDYKVQKALKTQIRAIVV